VNAAFLLVTTAWLAGADIHPAPIAAAPVATPVYSSAPAGGCTSCGGGGGSTCEVNTCCEQKECFLKKLLAKFKKDDCCQPACPTCNTCDTGCQKECFLDKLKAKFKKNDCCQPSCQPCQTCTASCGSCSDGCDACGKKECFLTKLLDKFKKKDCGCAPTCGCDNGGGYVTSGGNGGCANCGPAAGAAPVYNPAPVYSPAPIGTVIPSTPVPHVVPKVGEPIPAPMGNPLPKGQTSIQIIPQQAAPTLDTTSRPEIKEPF